MKLEGKVAVITGGAGGIGKGICMEFAGEGARVAVIDLNFEEAKKTAEVICRSQGPAEAWKVDVTNHKEIETVAQEIETSMGAIDIWVNNAGISYIMPFLECSEEIWEKTININLKGTFNGCQAALKRMALRKKGVIINISSQSGKIGNSQYAAYCASKFGVIGLTQSLAVEFADKGIRINALCPGVVFTPMWKDMANDYADKRNIKLDEVKGYMENKIPLGRLCTIEDVARAAVFLASDDAAYITGQSINISGGTVMS